VTIKALRILVYAIQISLLRVAYQKSCKIILYLLQGIEMKLTKISHTYHQPANTIQEQDTLITSDVVTLQLKVI